MKKKKISVIIFFLVIISIALWVYFKNNKDKEIQGYRLEEVERGSISRKVSCTGNLNAVVNVLVGSQVSGRLKDIYVDYNSIVIKDQVIAQIDDESLKAKLQQVQADLEVAQANVEIKKADVVRARADLDNAKHAINLSKAQVETARVNLAEAERDLNRMTELFKKNGAVSKAQYETAESAVERTKSQLIAALAQQESQVSQLNSKEAQLKMAEEQVKYALTEVKSREAIVLNSKIDLDHTVIRSPVDGIVIERNIDVGQTVAASLQAPTLFTIAQDLKKMQVNASVDEADIGRIQLNQKGVFSIDSFAGKEFVGIVQQIRKAPQVQQNVVTYTVVIAVDNPDMLLLPGMTANVTITTNERPNVLKIPNSALRFRHQEDSSIAPSKPKEKGDAKPDQERNRYKQILESLNLNEDQQNKIKNIYEKTREQFQLMKKQGSSPEDFRNNLKQVREQNKEHILSILTNDQKDSFLRMERELTTNPVNPGRVWLLSGDNNLRSIDIMVGLSDGNFTEVVKGDLKEGQKIIVGKKTVSAQSNIDKTKRVGLF